MYLRYLLATVTIGLVIALTSSESKANDKTTFSACIDCCKQACGPLPGQSGDVVPACFMGCIEGGTKSISNCRPVCPPADYCNKTQ